MQYVILIHADPRPWGHPTQEHTAAHRALPRETRDRLAARWEDAFAEATRRGEVVSSCALGDPAAATILRYDGTAVRTDGPYAESSEQLAGFFVIEVESRQRAEQLAAVFASPGHTIELRATMQPDQPR